MAKYAVVVSQSAEKELLKLPVAAILRIQEIIAQLGEEPRPANCKKLKGFRNLYRVRAGDYRVIYGIEDKILTVEVLRVGDRKDIYS